MTPVKELLIGDEVIVLGFEQFGTRVIAELLDQVKIPGGVVLNKTVDLFRWWNEDALRLVRRPGGA